MAMVKNSIRTKTYYCGTKNPEYIEIDLFPCLEQGSRFGRKGKEKVTAPKQRNLNAKRARRYFCLLLKTNFTEGDIHVTLTYNAKFLPKTIEQAEREVKNYLRRIANARKTQVGSGDRSEKIRTYNYPQGRITDHRIGMSIFQMENFLNGDLDEMIDNLSAADRAERLKGEEE